MTRPKNEQELRDSLGPGCRRLNKNVGKVTVTQRPATEEIIDVPGIEPIPASMTNVDVKAEKALQKQAEAWLHQRGYRRLTADNALYLLEHDAEFKGWFFHLFDARKGPFISDLVLMNPDKRNGTGQYLCIELKVRKVYQPGQRAMINSGQWIQCVTFEDFVLRVQEWEQ